MTTATHTTYEPRELEPVEGASRFFRHKGPAGWGGDLATNAALSLERLLVDKRADALTRKARPIEFNVRQVAWVDGEYVVELRGVYRAVRTLDPSTPGKIWRSGPGDPAVFDDFWLGGEAASKAADIEVWNGLCAALEANAPSTAAADLRSLNDLTAIALLLRNGVEAGIGSLPQGLPPARRSA